MATVFDRISNIIRANINDMLDSAEDPEAMLNQIIRDMSDTLRQADSDIADQIAAQKMIEGDLDEAKRNAAMWESRSEAAVKKNRDDLAREAIMRQNDYTEQVAIYGTQLEAQQRAVTELKSKRDLLKTKYEQAVRNKEQLIARARAAEAKTKMTKVTQMTNIPDYASEAERMERKIREMEARAEAEEELAEDNVSLEDEFQKLGDDQHVEDQLAALKAKMGK